MLLNDFRQVALTPSAVPLPTQVGQVLVQQPFNTPILLATNTAGIYQYDAIYDTFNCDSTALLCGQASNDALIIFDPVNLRVTAGPTQIWQPGYSFPGISYTKIFWSRSNPKVMYFVGLDGIYQWDYTTPSGSKILDYHSVDSTYVVDGAHAADSRGMSGDNNRIVVTSGNDGNGALAGKVRIFQISPPSLIYTFNINASPQPIAYIQGKNAFSRDGHWLQIGNQFIHVDDATSYNYSNYSYMDPNATSSDNGDDHPDWGTYVWMSHAARRYDGQFVVGWRLTAERKPGGQTWSGLPLVEGNQSMTGNNAGHTSFRTGKEDFATTSITGNPIPSGSVPPGAFEIWGWDYQGNILRICNHYATGDVYDRQGHHNVSQCGCFVAFQSDYNTAGQMGGLFIAQIKSYTAPTLPYVPVQWPIPAVPTTKFTNSTLAKPNAGGFGPLNIPVSDPSWWVQYSVNNDNCTFSVNIGSIRYGGTNFWSPPNPIPATATQVTITATGLDGSTDTLVFTCGPKGSTVIPPPNPNPIPQTVKFVVNEQPPIPPQYINNYNPVRATFVLQNSPIPNTDAVYMNGKRLRRGVDYVVTNGNQLMVTAWQGAIVTDNTTRYSYLEVDYQYLGG